MTINEAIDLGRRQHQAGNLASAKATYEQVLAQQPNQADALHLLGVIAHQSGNYDAALELIRRAISIDPNQADYHGNLGLALAARGNVDAAVASYERALKIFPDYPEALANLAEALRLKGDLNRSIAAANRAIELRPNFSQALATLGNALLQIGKAEDAVLAFRRLATLMPDSALAHYNVGVALRHMNQLDAAINAFQKAITLKSDFAEAHNNLGSALQSAGRIDDGIAAFRQALAIQPDSLNAANNLAVTFNGRHEFDEAVTVLHQALQRHPNWTQGWFSLGYALRCRGELGAGLDAYDRAAALEPDSPLAGSKRLYVLQFDPEQDAASIRSEHQKWNYRFARPLQEKTPPYSNERSANRRLRIGYVSPDFRSHCQAMFTIPLLAQYDHEQFEIFCYASVAQPDAITERLRGHADTWRSTYGMSDEAMNELIRNDRIDVLVDLTMHMAFGRPLLFARKPAPVQIAWLAYPGTTGLTAIDYRLTDPYLDPPGQYDDCYVERSIRLPNTFWCFDPLSIDSQEPALPAAPPFEKNGYVTFGCLNNFCKVNEAGLALWAGVLQNVPRSRLLTLAPPGHARRWMIDQLARFGVAEDRLEFVGRMQRGNYLDQFNRIDLCLDTIPYNGHTTSLDSAWMGVPVVTRVGRTVVGRAGLSQSHNLGLSELVAESDERFVAITTELANDLPRLSEIRRSMRQRLRNSPLMDSARFARGLEAVYRRAWNAWLTR